ncbi:DUF6894 family protein [Microvirga rosea]|uniref:DUF6894 family protein n=1 Tax=Microvirga rosea TaxID=2715425 RepID=UPI001D0B1BE1|nr:hypothetical protein [Microvirga rosea]MCB8821312.1 hypothetical protein [Microvirga rosea]
MPRFFFHFHDQNGFKQDEEGQDLPDVHAAHAEALKTAIEAAITTMTSVRFSGSLIKGRRDLSNILSSFAAVSGNA